MKTNETYAELHYATFKQRAAAFFSKYPKYTNRYTKKSDIPDLVLIKSSALKWMKSIAIERKYRTINELTSTNLKLNFTDIEIKRDHSGVISLTGAAPFSIEYLSITSLVKKVNFEVTAALYVSLKKELIAKLVAENFATAVLLSELFSAFQVEEETPRTGALKVTGSCKILHKLDASGVDCALAKRLWDIGFLNREVLSLTVKIFGFPGYIPEYNWVAKNYEQLVKRHSENPALCWMLSISGDQERLKQLKVWPLESLMFRESSLLSVGDTAFQCLKGLLAAKGLTDAGWRWLCKQGAWFVRGIQLTDDLLRFYSECAMLGLGRIPKGKNFSRLPNYISHSPWVRSVIKTYLAEICSKKIPANTFYMFEQVVDYGRHLPRQERDKPCKMSWKNLMVRQERWHRDIHAANYRHDHDYVWAGVLPKIEKDKLIAIELVSSKELIAEGRAMRHCVGGSHYAESCSQGQAAIYRITNKAGIGLATVELVLRGDRYTVNQCHGPANGPVAQTISAFAKFIGTSYTRKAKSMANKPRTLLAA